MKEKMDYYSQIFNFLIGAQTKWSKHRFELENALQKILGKKRIGEITGGRFAESAWNSERLCFTRHRVGDCSGNIGRMCGAFHNEISIMSKMPYRTDCLSL